MSAELPTPHAGVARWIARVDEVSAQEARCTGWIPGAHALVREGRVPAIVGLELGAQAAAALVRDGDGAREGYVAAIRDAVASETWLPAERELEVIARAAGSLGPLSLVDVIVRCEGREIVRGRLSLFLAPGG